MTNSDPRNTHDVHYAVGFGKPITSIAGTLDWFDDLDGAVEIIKKSADGSETMDGKTRTPENYFVTKVVRSVSYEDVDLDIEFPNVKHVQVVQELRALRENLTAAGTLNGNLNKMSLLNRIDAILSYAPKTEPECGDYPAPCNHDPAHPKS